jgi:hypothetical protein
MVGGRLLVLARLLLWLLGRLMWNLERVLMWDLWMLLGLVSWFSSKNACGEGKESELREMHPVLMICSVRQVKSLSGVSRDKCFDIWASSQYSDSAGTKPRDFLFISSRNYYVSPQFNHNATLYTLIVTSTCGLILIHAPGETCDSTL